jgi:hypothetical protein
MSDYNNPARNVDAARNLAESDMRHGIGPANTNNWDWTSRNIYEAERARIQKQQDDQRKQNGW